MFNPKIPAAIRADADSGTDAAKLDQLLAGLTTLTTGMTTLTKRLDSVEEKMEKKPDEEMPAAAAADKKKDDAGEGAEHGAKLDKILSHLGSMSEKHDALKTSCDSLHVKHDALSGRVEKLEAKPDAEPGAAEAKEGDKPALKEEREENGLKALDAATQKIDGLEKLLASLQTRLPAEIPAEQRQAFVDAQARHERIAQCFGDSAPSPLNGEGFVDYRRRLLSKVKDHSSLWKSKDLSKVDESVLDIAADQIYADAEIAATRPAPTADGVLTMREFKDPAVPGRIVRRFFGDASAWLDQFSVPKQYVTDFMTNNHSQPPSVN